MNLKKTLINICIFFSFISFLYSQNIAFDPYIYESINELLAFQEVNIEEPVVLFFWSSKNNRSIQQLDMIASKYKLWKETIPFTMLAIETNSTKEQVKTIASNKKWTFPIIVKQEKDVSSDMSKVLVKLGKATLWEKTTEQWSLSELKSALIKANKRNSSSTQKFSGNTKNYEFNVATILHTGIPVQRGDHVVIKSSGKVCLGVFAGCASPKGINGFFHYSINSDVSHGALIYRIDGTDQWLKAGSHVAFTAKTSGSISLAVNDKDTFNNSGSYKVIVSVTHPE